MILALDLGSTSFKAGVFDGALTLRGLASRPIENRYAPGGCVELEAEEVATAFQHVLRGAIDEAGVSPKTLSALAVTSQAQTFTIVDPAGRAKMPFISWQDTRAQETCELLKRDPKLADFARHPSFGEILPVLQVCQLEHLQTSRPGFLTREDRVVSLPTYLVEECTGTFAVDDNLAAMSGLYSLDLDDWWPPALEVCRLESRQLAKLVSVGSVASFTHHGAARFGLLEGVPVVLAGNDQTAGAFGAELHEEGGLLITLGTAQVAYACADDLPAPDGTTIRGPYPGGLHYRMAADSCGGNLISWAGTFLAGCETDSAFFCRVDDAEPGCGGLEFDVESPRGEGAWRNIGLHHTSADFARSVVECLVRRMAVLVRRLGVDRSAGKVLVAGGGSRSDAWVRILSEELGAPLTVTEADPLRGAARMARVGYA